MDINEPLPAERAGFFAAVGGLFAAWRRQRRLRLARIELSQLDAHLLRDIGIEPLDVYDALNGRRRSIVLNPMRRPDHE